MINDIPWNEINFECYSDGDRLMGLATFDMPEIEYLSTDIKGNGIAGEFSVPTRGHLNNLTATLHWRILYENPIQFLAQGTGHMLSLRGAWERCDAATGVRSTHSLRLDMRGHTSKLTMGKWEPGETSETELEMSLDYIKMICDDIKVFEHDKFNFVHEVEGTDYLRDVRYALGL